jgi:hypothetical protein
MTFPLTFTLRYRYNSLEPGITVPTVLRLKDRTAYCDASVDTGAQVCVFQREVGESLDLEIEGGHRIVLGSLGGPVVAFGHSVTLSTFELEFDSVVYFAENYNLPRNLLGRDGWLQKVRLGVVDYDAEVYLALYGDATRDF